MLLSVNPGMCLSFSVNQNDFIKFSVYTLILWYSQEVSRDVMCRLSACHLLQKSLVNIWLGWNIHLCFLMHGLFKTLCCALPERLLQSICSLCTQIPPEVLFVFSLFVFSLYFPMTLCLQILIIILQNAYLAMKNISPSLVIQK